MPQKKPKVTPGNAEARHMLIRNLDTLERAAVRATRKELMYKRVATIVAQEVDTLLTKHITQIRDQARVLLMQELDTHIPKFVARAVRRISFR